MGGDDPVRGVDVVFETRVERRDDLQPSDVESLRGTQQLDEIRLQRREFGERFRTCADRARDKRRRGLGAHPDRRLEKPSENPSHELHRWPFFAGHSALAAALDRLTQQRKKRLRRQAEMCHAFGGGPVRWMRPDCEQSRLRRIDQSPRALRGLDEFLFDRLDCVHQPFFSIASPSSRERRVAASTAFISVVRTPPCSSV